MSTSERRALAAFRGLLEATSVQEAMAHVAAIASASAGADLAAVFLRVDGEARLRLVAGDGCPAGLVGTLELALGDGAPAALALERRAPVLSTEVEALRAWATDPLLEALTSWVATPMVHAGEPIGALLVGRRDGPALGATEAALCGRIADLAAVAVDRLRAAAEGDRRRQEAEALEAIGRELTSTLDHAVVLQRITDRARELAGGDFAFIAPLEAGGQAAVIAAVSGARTAAAMGLRMEPGLGVSGRVLSTGEPFVTEHYLTDPRVSQEHAEIIAAEGAGRRGRAAAALPRADHRGPGRGQPDPARLDRRGSARARQARGPRGGGHRECAPARGGAPARGAAADAEPGQPGGVRVARPRRGPRGHRARRHRALRRHPGVDLDGRRRGAGGRVARLLGSPAARGLPGAPRRAQRGLRGLGRRPPHDDRGARRLRRPALSPLRDGLVAEARAQELRGRAHHPGRPPAGRALVRSSARPLRLGAEERELLDTLVGQAALAMRNARLFAATEEREREASALFDVTRRLGATLDVEEILGIVSEGTARAMGSDAAGFFRWDEARERLVVARAVNFSPGPAESLAIRSGEGVSGRAYAERRVCWTDDRVADAALCGTRRTPRPPSPRWRRPAPTWPRRSFCATGCTACW